MAGVHHHLVREGARTRCALVLESGDAREVHHVALLIGYGAGAVNPYLAFESLDDQDVSGENSKIEVGGGHAEAACSGTARYVPKVGSRTPRAEARQWTVILRRARDGWLIDHVNAR